MNPNISLPQLPANLDPALRDYLFAWQKLITSKQLDDYSANTSVDSKANAIEARLAKIESMYRVGSIYISVNNVNPSTWMTDTTWVAFGTGRTLVGVDTSQTEFNTVEKTGGAKTHLLTPSETAIRNHSHAMPGMFYGGSGWSTGYRFANGSGTLLTADNSTYGTTEYNAITAHNNLQPYVTVYFWKRTA